MAIIELKFLLSNEQSFVPMYGTPLQKTSPNSAPQHRPAPTSTQHPPYKYPKLTLPQLNLLLRQTFLSLKAKVILFITLLISLFLHRRD